MPPEAPVVIVTGGGSGIGRAVAETFARNGGRLALVGRRPEPLNRVAGELENRGTAVISLPEDLRQAGATERVVDATLERFSRVDVLVNNAGVPGEGVPLHSLSDELWDEILATNLTAAFRMLRAVLPTFMERRQGVVVNVASTAALKAMPNMAAYSASKAALIALTRSVALDYAAFGVRCNAVCPGTTATAMTRPLLDAPVAESRILAGIPMGRVAEPSEIAEVIVQLSSNVWSYATGLVVTVDGGQTLA